ncbi:hypothetical protein D3C71_1580280 [compost metagenome]
MHRPLCIGEATCDEVGFDASAPRRFGRFDVKAPDPPLAPPIGEQRGNPLQNQHRVLRQHSALGLPPFAKHPVVGRQVSVDRATAEPVLEICLRFFQRIAPQHARAAFGSGPQPAIE